MLPKDAKKRHSDTKIRETQSHLDSHLREMPQKERIVPYTDENFRDAAIEWLVSMDQVRTYHSSNYNYN